MHCTQMFDFPLPSFTYNCKNDGICDHYLLSNSDAHRWFLCFPSRSVLVSVIYYPRKFVCENAVGYLTLSVTLLVSSTFYGGELIVWCVDGWVSFSGHMETRFLSCHILDFVLVVEPCLELLQIKLHFSRALPWTTFSLHSGPLLVYFCTWILLPAHTGLVYFTVLQSVHSGLRLQIWYLFMLWWVWGNWDIYMQD